MSMEDFVKTLTDEQRLALLKALSGGDSKAEVPDEPLNTHPPFVDTSRWQHEEPVSEAVDGPADFTMDKDRASKKRTPIVASKNTWKDTGEHSDVSTPDVARTPRNRPPPKKKEVRCHSCGKTFSVSPSVMFGEYYRCDRCIG